jgi:hypothetical protein
MCCARLAVNGPRPPRSAPSAEQRCRATSATRSARRAPTSSVGAAKSTSLARHGRRPASVSSRSLRTRPPGPPRQHGHGPRADRQLTTSPSQKRLRGQPSLASPPGKRPEAESLSPMKPAPRIRRQLPPRLLRAVLWPPVQLQVLRRPEGAGEVDRVQPRPSTVRRHPRRYRPSRHRLRRLHPHPGPTRRPSPTEACPGSSSS